MLQVNFISLNDENPAVVSCSYLFWTLSALCFIVSSLTGNMSQVDKLWSVVPCVYAWILVKDMRTVVMATLVTLWGIRLSYNFYRRGGYTFPRLWCGEEDYRWSVLRSGRVPHLTFLKHPFVWMIFNLLFISIYQHFLLLAIVSPSIVASSAATHAATEVSWTTLDTLASSLFLFFLVLEAKADNQQYAFQREKLRKVQLNEDLLGDYKDGFLHTSGLYAYVRKPNYAAEQALWITYYLFSVAACRGRHNWSILGCTLLVLLFQGSGWLTELLTIQKYPKYEVYKNDVPLYLPSLWQLFSFESLRYTNRTPIKQS
jgi:steroid 5-alpha reductase family enzyme